MKCPCNDYDINHCTINPKIFEKCSYVQSFQPLTLVRYFLRPDLKGYDEIIISNLNKRQWKENLNE